MNEQDGRLYWMGKPIEDMSKEQLIAIIRGLMAQLEGSRAALDAIYGLTRRRSA